VVAFSDRRPRAGRERRRPAKPEDRPPSLKVPVRRYWDLLSRYLRRRRGRFTLLSTLLLAGIGLQIAIPQITRRFIDLAQAGAAYRLLLTAAIGFLAVSLLQQGVTVLAHYVGERVAWNATNDIRLDLARHCLNLDMGWHTGVSPGQLIERIDGDLLTVSQFFSQLVVMVIGSVLLLAGILVALCLEDLRLGGVFTGFSAAMLLLFIRLRNIAVPHDAAWREAASQLFGYIEERLAGTEDIRSCGAVDFVLLGLYRLHYTILQCWRKAELLHVTIRLWAGLMMSAGYGIAFVGGYRLYRSGALTLGAVYLVVQYTELIARPIRIITQQFQELQSIGANVERVNELFAVTSRIRDPDPAIALFEPGPREGRRALPVVFEGVTFGYAKAEPVLRDVCFAVEPGQVLGVLGRTGSGKTTLARLLFRLYDPDEGRILLDSADLQRYRLADLRRRVAMVTQDVQLFQASIRDNLTFFDASIEDRRLTAALEELGLAGWLRGLPAGLDTRVETGGKGLSAGEAQLLAFTRIFLRDPGLVVLDEASSRLDPATEALIERVVDRLLAGRTAIVIAHRLGTVNRADRILILEDGRVLAADEGSRFHRLLRAGLEEVTE
jgi:ATP-binding cassette subfamily B protein